MAGRGGAGGGGARLTTAADWLAAQSAGAPAPLAARAARYLALEPAGELPVRLAGAARRALEVVLAHPVQADRAVALDLLTADALVTLALKAQAAGRPEELARFAAQLRGAEVEE